LLSESYLRQQYLIPIYKMQIKEIIQHLESIAPSAYQESYDNSGLIVGDANTICTGVLVCLDSTEDIVNEAITKGCNLIVAHHPIVFKGLKKFNGKNYVERTVIKAIKNDVAIYAIHTNLDNVFFQGVNTMIAEKLGLKNTKILVNKIQTLSQLTTFSPIENTQAVLDAMYSAGAGQIGAYKNCSFRTEGIGTFQPTDDAQPHIGELNKNAEVKENRIEVIFPTYLASKIIQALKKAHPYEEVAYYLQSIENENQEVGSGIIGELEMPYEALDFLTDLKKTMQCAIVRYTQPLQKKVQRIAVCGGAGSFLLKDAMAQGADVFVTADYKYHEFFDADGRIIIADIGHFESEQYTIQLIFSIISKKFPNFAVYSTGVNTNPVKYL
jgi:dinuclear metal center YbgI/SA1388 family protein